MKVYNITVNGISYEVIVEEISSTHPPQNTVGSANTTATLSNIPISNTPDKSIEQVIQKISPTAAEKVSADEVQNGKAITSPMSGTILEVLVKEGDAVEVGQTVIVLEAMKMENEIASTLSGIVKRIETEAGMTVNAGDKLVWLNEKQ